MPDKIEFSKAAEEILKIAKEEATAIGSDSIGSEHLLLGIITDPTMQSLLKESKISIPLMRVCAYSEAGIYNLGLRMADRLNRIRKLDPNMQLGYTPRVKQVLDNAIEAARRSESQIVEPKHLLESILAIREGIGFSILEALGLDKEAILKKLKTF